MPRNAAFYIADPSILGSHLFESLPAMESYSGLEEEDGSASGIELQTEWGRITMNFMPQELLESHKEGFANYVRSRANHEDTMIACLARLYHVRMCVGCVIQHEEADTKRVEDFLFAFNRSVNGLLFFYDSIFDWTGEKLAGPS